MNVTAHGGRLCQCKCTLYIPIKFKSTHRESFRDMSLKLSHHGIKIYEYVGTLDSVIITFGSLLPAIPPVLFIEHISTHKIHPLIGTRI